MKKIAPLLAVLLSCVAPGAPLARAPAQSFRIDEASIRAAFEKARTAVATELALDPVPPIPVRISTRREIAGILTEELTAQFLTQIDDPQTARREARLSARVLAEGFLAKYATGEACILVSPDTFAQLASLIDEPGLVSEQALCATLAHECVHAFDAKRYGWPERLAKLKGFEAIEAYSAVLEGHAQRVARAACARSGWKEGFETVTRSIGKLPEQRDEVMRLIARIIETTIVSHYTDGERFIDAIERKGGEAAVARAFREPPPDMETILHPEWFLDPASRPAVAYTVEAGLDALASRFDKKIWMAQRLTVTRPQLEAALSLLPSQDLARILDHMERNRAVVLVPKDAPESKMVTAGLYIFSSAQESAFYIAAAERLSRIKDEKMKEGFIRIVASNYTPLRGPGWQALVVEKTVEAGGPVLRAYPPSSPRAGPSWSRSSTRTSPSRRGRWPASQQRCSRRQGAEAPPQHLTRPAGSRVKPCFRPIEPGPESPRSPPVGQWRVCLIPSYEPPVSPDGATSPDIACSK